MAKKYHPDLNQGNEYAHKMFILSKYTYNIYPSIYINLISEFFRI